MPYANLDVGNAVEVAVKFRCRLTRPTNGWKMDWLENPVPFLQVVSGTNHTIDSGAKTPK